MRIDFWKTEREKAEILPCGLKVLKGETTNGSPLLMMWKPKGKKPFSHYRYRSEEQRQAAIDQAVSDHLSHLERKAKYKEERRGTEAQLELVQVGFIFVCSWGYDQTNVDFYQVIEKNGRIVTLREIAQNAITSEGFSPMSDHRTAKKGEFLENSKPFKKKLQFTKSGVYVSMTSYSSAHIWDGTKKYCSWYA